MNQPLSPAKSPPTAQNAIPPDPRGGGALTRATGGGRDGALNSPSEILGSEVFVVSETLLAAVTGMPARAIGNMRVKKLARGRDWELADGTALLAEKSLPLLMQALGLNLTPPELQHLAEQCRSKNAPAQFTAVVCRFPPNPKLLTVKWTEGELERTANLITPKREHFRIGMAVPIRLNPASQRYELARKAPRAKGRW